MLRIAVPNKGSLAEPAAAMLREAGYRTRRDPKELIVTDAENGVELFYLRPRDIAVYVGSGTVDCGVTGRDLLLDSGSAAVEVMGLGFGASTFRYAARPGTASALGDIEGRRVATSYQGLVEKHLADHGVSAQVVRLDGAVETAITLGVADVIADVVETGATLRAAGLETFGEPVLQSEAVLVTRSGADLPDSFPIFLRRLQGVLVARSFVMMDYDIAERDLPEAVKLTPGIEGPTIAPLRREGWVAVRAMVPRDGAQRLMDRLHDLGARGILLTDIHACRL